MPPHQEDSLTEQQIDVLFRAALDVVKDNFHPSDHLPKGIYDFLLPISTSTCQGLYATVMLFLGAMPSLSNGASVRLWSRAPSPLALMVLHMAPAQRGKSRLYQATETLFEAADDFVEMLAKAEARKVTDRLMSENAGTQQLPDLPFQTKSICLQSFTMTEFFYRCSADYPQVEIQSGTKKDKIGLRLWYGQAFNLDEAYEFLENLSLLGGRGDKSKDSSINAHASTLNTLLLRGKTKRATRTSTSYEASRTQHVTVSVLGNGHPSKLIPMERNLEGQHTAATKERFLLCVDMSVARHDALPRNMLLQDGALPPWTWLPLTPLQATIFGWSGLLNNPSHFHEQNLHDEDGDGAEGYPAVLPDGVASRVRYVYATDRVLAAYLFLSLLSLLAHLLCFLASLLALTCVFSTSMKLIASCLHPSYLVFSSFIFSSLQQTHILQQVVSWPACWTQPAFLDVNGTHRALPAYVFRLLVSPLLQAKNPSTS